MEDLNFTRELCEQVVYLMRQYHYNPNGSDYECAHCYMSPRTNSCEIVHKEDCIGLKAEQWLADHPE